MENLHWELSVLSKSVHYKNLSAAAAHIGLSQPQLSRIISRLEQDLGVVLLDRTVRRKSGWTPIAFKIAETYFRASRKLTHSLQLLKSDDHVTQITVGTLEGLVPLASEFCRMAFDETKITLLELNAYDLSELEERFERDEIDLVFTCREPGKHKYKNVHNLGFQSLARVGNKTGTRVFSQFEYANEVHLRKNPSKQATRSNAAARVLISNSLIIRKLWIENHDGVGYIPSGVTKKKSTEADVPVMMIASDLMSPSLWEKFEKFEL